MSSSGVFSDAQAQLVASLTDLGLSVTTDIRNARPLSVVVRPPFFTIKNYNWADITFLISICAAPPGNSDAVDYMLTTADAIMDSEIVVVEGSPSTLNAGNQELPCYDMTVRMGGEGH